MNPLLAQFIEESRELLEQMGEGLLSLEQDPRNSDVLNQIFRSVHTIKGNSGLFDFPAVTQLVHAAEDVLDTLRSKEMALSGNLVDTLLATADRIGQWINQIETDEHLPTDAVSVAGQLGLRLRAFIESGDQSESKEKDSPDAEANFDWTFFVKKIPDGQRRELYKLIQSKQEPLFCIHYSPDEQCFFQGEDPLYLMRQIPDLYWLQLFNPKPWPPLADFDAYLCNVHYFALSAAPKSELDHLFRYTSDRVKIEELGHNSLVIPTGIRNGGPVYEDYVDESLALLKRGERTALHRSTSSLLELTNPDLWLASALQWLLLLLENADTSALQVLLCSLSQQEDPKWNGEAVIAESSDTCLPPIALRTTHEMETFREILREQMFAITIPVDADLREGRLLSIEIVLKNCLTYMGMDEKIPRLEESIKKSLELRSESAVKETMALWIAEMDRAIGDGLELSPDSVIGKTSNEEIHEEKDKTGAKVLKVDQAKIDALMSLIGEMVVAKNSLPYLSRRAEEVYEARDLAREIKEQYGVINRISQEMQSAIMHVRMLPLSNVLQRFPRLVRDLARKMNKKIQLVLEGEETEADKNIIEALADPLIHIVRNAADHGLETPEERIDAGKKAEGSICIVANQENDRVVIEVRDDGRGIDPEIVKRKALECGLLDEERARTISERDAIQLVFHPGFSTSKQITDLSGRGVGMDVVHSTVDRLGGSVSVSSQKGKGTTVRLALPMSMAVTRIIVIKAGRQIFGVPIDHVVETVRIASASIFHFKHKEVFVLRNSLVPLMRLRHLLQLPEEKADNGEVESAILVARLAGENVGFVVDDFRENTEIILKPLEGIMAHVKGYTGTAVLGDGTVLLVLDLKELLEW